MKRQFIIEEYEIWDGEVIIIFTFDEKNYYEDVISEDLFEDFVEKIDSLYYYVDRWDGYTESHYTEDVWMDYFEWVNEHVENDDIKDFIESYYEKNDLPKCIVE